jgi:hypothetical protein
MKFISLMEGREHKREQAVKNRVRVRVFIPKVLEGQEPYRKLLTPTIEREKINVRSLRRKSWMMTIKTWHIAYASWSNTSNVSCSRDLVSRELI